MGKVWLDAGTMGPRSCEQLQGAQSACMPLQSELCDRSREQIKLAAFVVQAARARRERCRGSEFKSGLPTAEWHPGRLSNLQKSWFLIDWLSSPAFVRCSFFLGGFAPRGRTSGQVLLVLSGPDGMEEEQVRYSPR